MRFLIKAYRFWLRIVLTSVLVLQIGLGLTFSQLIYASEPNNTYTKPGSSSTGSTPSQIEKIANDITAQGVSEPSTIEATKKLEDLAAEIEGASATVLPKEIANTFYLVGQTLNVTSQGGGAVKAFDLGRSNLELPTILVQDFDKDIKIEIDRAKQTLSFVKHVGEVEQARHEISGLDVLTYARDKEILQFIGSNGKIYAIDMAFARHRDILFKTPLPVFTVGVLPAEFMSQIESLKISFVTRGLKPPNLINENAVIPVGEASLVKRDSTTQSIVDLNLQAKWDASHLILYKDVGSSRELFGLYNRGVTLDYIQRGFAVLHLLAYAVSPEGQADSVMTEFGNAEAVQGASGIERTMDKLTREAFSAFKPEVVAQVTQRVGAINANKNAPRDKFLLNEWQKSFEEFHNQAITSSSSELEEAANKGNLNQHWQEFTKKRLHNEVQVKQTMFKRLVTGKGLKRLAAITAGYGAVIAAHLSGGSLVDGAGPVWAVHAANTIYDVLPDVLKDAEYRVTMFKGAHALASGVLLTYIVGVLAGKKMGWDFKKALATMGIRTAAFLQMSFIARLANLSRQKSFIMALRAGSNPFAKILPDSAEGQMAGLTEAIRPGVNNPFLSNDQLLERSEVSRRVLEARYKIKQRRKAMASVLANLVVAEKFGIDPATLIMAEKGDLDGVKIDQLNAEIHQLKQNPIVFAQWKKIAQEVYFATKTAVAFKEDISNISKEELADFYRIAKTTAEKMSKRSLFKEVTTKLRMAWHKVAEGNIYKSIGDFGYDQYQFLKNVEATDFVAKQTWEQFVFDVIPTILQIPLVGARADIIGAQTDPKIRNELAHSENNFAWTTDGHKSDMINQFLIYLISVPARMAQVYGDAAAVVKENIYNPIEEITHVSSSHSEGYLRGLWSWMKGAGNLSEAGYGHLFKKEILRRIKAVQLAFIMDFSCRVLIAGQAAAAALPAFAYSLIMAEWLYAWPWKPITRGNQIYQDRIDANNEKLIAAQTKISQGLRIGDEELWRDGFTALRSSYLENTKDKFLSKNLKALEAALLLSPEELLEREKIIKERVAPVIGSIIRLKIALEGADKSEASKSEIAQAENELRARYLNGELSIDENLDAQTLLEYSIAHPPIYNKPNSKISSTLNFAGSLITTYLGTIMFVDTLREHSWAVKFTDALLFSIPMYFSVYYIQRGIDNYVKTNEYIRLREQLPAQAFENAAANKPKFKTLEEYALWLKNNSQSLIIRNADVGTIVQVLTNGQDLNRFIKSALLRKINAQNGQSIANIKKCAVLLSGDSVNSTPNKMSLGEKTKTRLKGVFKPPTQ